MQQSVKTDLEKTLRTLIEDSSEKMTKRNQGDFILTTTKQRLAQEYEMTFDAEMDHKLSMPEEKAKEFVSELRSEIKGIGNVNIDSIKQYEEINQRYTTLFSSQEELSSAQQTIISAISKMDQIIVTKLDETIKNVNNEIGDIFKVMFGGGNAYVKIYRSNKTFLKQVLRLLHNLQVRQLEILKLFSGGEKSLIAISLLFCNFEIKTSSLSSFGWSWSCTWRCECYKVCKLLARA